MPLRDHFHLPLRGLCTWDSFHSGWTNEIVRQLNRSLPSEYVARPNVKLGVDVDNGRGLATAVWAPSAASFSIPVDFQHLDVFEVQVHREGGLELVAAIELVSPRNKDRPSARSHFIAKCVAYLQAGVSVAIVDVVTSRRESLYKLLLEQLAGTEEVSGAGDLYAVALRVLPPDAPAQLEGWPMRLAVGSSLPTLPLWLEHDFAVPLDLERTYEANVVELRVPV